MQSARIIGFAEDRAAAIIFDTKLVGTKSLKKVRKRAARETRALHDEVRRMKAETAIELRRDRLAAAFVRGRTFRFQERANSLSRDIETRAKIWTDRERQHRQSELELARIEQERKAAEAAITQAQDTAAGILATAEARVEEARQALAKADADRIEAEGLVSAAREKASRITEAAEDRAGVIVADATALATVTVRKSRKRAIADARARRAETDRMAAAAEREWEAAETRAEQARQAQARAQTEREAAEEAAVAARAEAERAMARVDVVTTGLDALIEEVAAGTLRALKGGGVKAAAPDLLRPAFPEIRPAVSAAARVVEKIHAARREADDVARRVAAEQEKAKCDIARDRATAASEIAKQHEAVNTELKEKRERLGRMEKDLKDKLSLVMDLYGRLQFMWGRVMSWLSSPELPASMKEDGVDLVAEGLAMSSVVTPDDPES